MSDFLDKYAERGLLSYLDVTDDIEALLPGPSEKERNESRLRKIITGEKRPGSHTAKEAGAWAASNIALPVLAGALKGVSTASKLGRGAASITKAGGGKITKKSMKIAKEIAEKEAKKTAEEVVKADAETKGGSLISKLIKRSLADKNPVHINARAAKEVEKNVNKAIEAINKYPPKTPFGDIVKKEAKKDGLKAAVATGAGVRAGDVIANSGVDTGDYNPLKEDVNGYDNRLEMSKPRKFWQFIKGLFDRDDLNPDIYPMDQINYLVDDLFDKKIGTLIQKERLGDAEKIKLIKDVGKGIYDTDDTAFSYELYKTYMNMLNEEGEEK